MKLWNRFKYLLLRWLLDDICRKSDCENCIMRTRVRIDSCDYKGWGCEEQDIFYQALRVWRIE